MLHKLLILASLTLLLLLSSACRDKNDKVPTIPLNKNFKEFIYFKENSWWVYEHTVDSTRDSIAVVSSEIKIEPRYTDNWESEIGWYVEWFYYNTYSYLTGRLLEYKGATACSRHLGEEKLKNRERPCFYAYRDMGNTLTLIFFYYPVIGYEAKPMGFSTITIAEYYDSLQVGGRYYQDIYRIHETKNPLEGMREINFYIARGYGIIRKEINDKERDMDPDNWQHWNLVNCHIIH
jgi:hypothetical protein